MTHFLLSFRERLVPVPRERVAPFLGFPGEDRGQNALHALRRERVLHRGPRPAHPAEKPRFHVSEILVPLEETRARVGRLLIPPRQHGRRGGRRRHEPLRSRFVEAKSIVLGVRVARLSKLGAHLLRRPRIRERAEVEHRLREPCRSQLLGVDNGVFAVGCAVQRAAVRAPVHAVARERQGEVIDAVPVENHGGVGGVRVRRAFPRLGNPRERSNHARVALGVARHEPQDALHALRGKLGRGLQRQTHR